MSGKTDRLVRQRFAPGTTTEDLKAYMAPFVATLGYKFNTEDEFVDEVLASELEIMEKTGDVFCPCRIRTGDPKEDAKIVCPCIPFYLEQFAAMRKCWCGLFIRTDVEDGAELIGVIEEPEDGVPVDVPVCRVEDLADGQVRHIKIGKRDIALVRVGEEYFALSNLCRHAYGPLSDGVLDGCYLMCPWHGWRYDVRDGSTDHPDADVRTYEVVMRDGLVMVVVTLH
ncbi:MAG: ferredoxin-thioredoxin reductase catalytic domain-containing protein [Coriobacteriia bacterium]|nr:ferredoxin-thioredoxin reductase catalytic domain-containing protein [Coriobacteriia bacterium]